MAKFMGPRFKQCRRLGLNVCGHPKAMNRAAKGTSRADRKLSAYGTQLLEKQRLKAYYGVLEKQFSNYVKKAIYDKETSGYSLLKRLECRLDNLVYRLGFASSIRQARQFVGHGHFLVNGAKVDIPSYTVKPEDVITLKEASRKISLFKDTWESNFLNSYPYLSKNEDFTGSLVRYPERNELPIEIDEILVVEFYSK